MARVGRFREGILGAVEVGEDVLADGDMLSVDQNEGIHFGDEDTSHACGMSAQRKTTGGS